MSNQITQFKKHELQLVKRSDIPKSDVLRSRINKGTLPSKYLFDFRSILKRHYPELLVNTKKMPDELIAHLEDHGFSKYKWTSLINNTRPIMYWDIVRFSEVVATRCRLILQPPEIPIKQPHNQKSSNS